MICLCGIIPLGEFETFLTKGQSPEKTKLKEQKMKINKKSSTRYLARGALIAAAYAVASYLSMPLQILFFQFRLSEALCILPIFMPEAVVGLFIGCLTANYISGCVIWDVLFGSLATLIGAIGARLLSRLPKKLMFLSTLPTVLANALIVPFVIMYAYGSSESYLFLFITVFVGEFVTATVMGTALYYYLDKRNLKF